MGLLSEQQLHNLAMNVVGKDLEEMGYEFLAVNSKKSKNPQFVATKDKKLIFIYSVPLIPIISTVKLLLSTLTTFAISTFISKLIINLLYYLNYIPVLNFTQNLGLK